MTTALLLVGAIAAMLGFLWWAEVKAHDRLVKQIMEGQEDK